MYRCTAAKAPSESHFSTTDVSSTLELMLSKGRKERWDGGLTLSSDLMKTRGVLGGSRPGVAQSLL